MKQAYGWNICSILCAAIFFVTGCTEQLQGEEITEGRMQIYLSALDEIKETDPELLKKLGTLYMNDAMPQESIETIKGIVSNSGFSGLNDFRDANTKILSIFYSLNSTSKPGRQLSELKEIQKEDERRFEQMLNVPGVSEKRKAEISQSREAVRAAYEQSAMHLEENYDNSSFTLDDKESVAIVEKYWIQLDAYLSYDKESEK